MYEKEERPSDFVTVDTNLLKVEVELEN